MNKMAQRLTQQEREDMMALVDRLARASHMPAAYDEASAQTHSAPAAGAKKVSANDFPPEFFDYFVIE